MLKVIFPAKNEKKKKDRSWTALRGRGVYHVKHVFGQKKSSHAQSN